MVTGTTNMTAANVIGAPVPPALKDVPVKSDRRSNKPIMEKRRRARINNCLNELKTLILDATKKDPARHSKLEKADILEKTVKHLQELQRQQATMQQVADPKIINKFKAGFADCANEVSRFPGLDPVVKRRLLHHLSNCINGVKIEMHHQQRQTAAVAVAAAQQIHTQMLPSPPSSPEQDQHHLKQQHQATTASNSFVMTSGNTQLSHNVNGGTYFLPNGLQVIPTKLPNGSIALVLPQSLSQQHQQLQQQQQQQQQHYHQHQLQVPVRNIHPQTSLLMPIPARTASTSSASSHSSYERTTSPPSGSIHSYAPPSPANSYDAMDCKPLIMQQTNICANQHQQFEQLQQQHLLQQQNLPLSLVIKKNIKEEDQPWRPW